MKLAPTLVAARTALPPKGACFALGRPGGKTLAPTLVAARTALPPKGARFALGRPGDKTLAPTPVAARTALDVPVPVPEAVAARTVLACSP